MKQHSIPSKIPKRILPKPTALQNYSIFGSCSKNGFWFCFPPTIPQWQLMRKEPTSCKDVWTRNLIRKERGNASRSQKWCSICYILHKNCAKMFFFPVFSFLIVKICSWWVFPCRRQQSRDFHAPIPHMGPEQSWVPYIYTYHIDIDIFKTQTEKFLGFFPFIKWVNQFFFCCCF